MVECNPSSCESCQYIGDGDFFCDTILEIVIEDWEPTENYMGPGCPHRKKENGGVKRVKVHKKKQPGRN